MTVKEEVSLPTNQNAKMMFFRKSNPFNKFMISKLRDAETRYIFLAKAEEAKRTEHSY